MSNLPDRVPGRLKRHASWRRWASYGLVVAIATATLAGCRNSNKTERPEEVFRRWNELAGESDPKALALICAAPGTEDTYDSPITSYRAGFPVVRADGSGNKVPALHVGRNDENGSAVIDFTDPGTSTVGDEDDVYVSMVKERTGWKVCRVQITAAGGFG